MNISNTDVQPRHMGDGDNDSAGFSQCIHQGAIPLYLLAVGFVTKLLLCIIIDYWFAHLLRQKEEEEEECTRIHQRLQEEEQRKARREQRHKTTETSNPIDTATISGLADSPPAQQEMKTNPDDVEQQEPERSDPHKPHNKKDVDSAPVERKEDKPLCRLRCCLCVNILVWCWTAFKIITPIIQLAMDISRVQSSDTGSGWHRYQCYAEVFSNSPNVESVWMLGFVLSKTEAKTGFDSKGWVIVVPVLCWVGLLICPFITHTLPFLGAYIWVSLVLFGGFALFTVIVAEVVDRICDCDDDDPLGRLIKVELPWMGLGLVLSLAFAIGTSTMIRLYSGDSSYIDALWWTMSRRTTRGFLHDRVQTAQEARNRWYSFIHFFV